MIFLSIIHDLIEESKRWLSERRPPWNKSFAHFVEANHRFLRYSLFYAFFFCNRALSAAQAVTTPSRSIT